MRFHIEVSKDSVAAISRIAHLHAFTLQAFTDFWKLGGAEGLLRAVAGGAPRRTGKYASGHEARVVVRGAAAFPRATTEIRAPHPLSSFIVKGTKPHRIEPRKPGGVLAFYWERKGKFVFLKGVNHPGTRPNKYHIAAYDQWAPGARVELKARLGRLYHG